ncbi:MAG: hypothetical protein ABSD68_01610 [Candidatus Micrarchaeales archaeon]|jgi:hypothetical protein
MKNREDPEKEKSIKIESQGLREYNSPNFKTNYLCLVTNLSKMQGIHLEEWFALRLGKEVPSLPINPGINSENYSKAHANIIFDRKTSTLGIYIERHEEDDRRIYYAAAICEAELACLKRDPEGFLKHIEIITVLRRTAMEEGQERVACSSEDISGVALLSVFSFGPMGSMVYRKRK